MTIYTIGFSQKSAQEFFGLLTRNGVRTLVDVRLNNRSQLAGFTKGRDLPFFLEKICGIAYRHDTFLAPTKALLDGYKQETVEWDKYVTIYRDILQNRNIAGKISLQDYDGACLLCSEPTAERCHRRLAAEFIVSLFPQEKCEIVHL